MREGSRFHVLSPCRCRLLQSMGVAAARAGVFSAARSGSLPRCSADAVACALRSATRIAIALGFSAAVFGYPLIRAFRRDPGYLVAAREGALRPQPAEAACRSGDKPGLAHEPPPFLSARRHFDVFGLTLLVRVGVNFDRQPAVRGRHLGRPAPAGIVPMGRPAGAIRVSSWVS
jgi:hypothetical protein